MDCSVYYKKMEICLENLYSKHLDDGIFELRCKFEVILPESYIFSIMREKIILTNGFVKNTENSLREEIQIAKDRRKDFIERVM